MYVKLEFKAINIILFDYHCLHSVTQRLFLNAGGGGFSVPLQQHSIRLLLHFTHNFGLSGNETTNAEFDIGSEYAIFEFHLCKPEATATRLSSPGHRQVKNPCPRLSREKKGAAFMGEENTVAECCQQCLSYRSEKK